jgi:tetratricopeptide (TPR) repeat protein
MLFIKQNLRWCALFLVVLLVACGQSTPVKNQIAEQDFEIKSFSFDAIKKQPISKREFGPSPYMQSAAEVPSSALNEYRFAIEALRGGNQDLGEQQLKEMLEKYPDLSGPAYNLAVLNKEQGNLEQAEAYLDRALTINSANYDARNLQATLLREKGEFDQAEQAYLGILKSWGGYEPAYRNVGVLYDLYLGRAEDALVYYRQYNHMLDEPDPQVNGWIVDIERRYGIAPLSTGANTALPQATADDGDDYEMDDEQENDDDYSTDLDSEVEYE